MHVIDDSCVNRATGMVSQTNCDQKDGPWVILRDSEFPSGVPCNESRLTSNDQGDCERKFLRRMPHTYRVEFSGNALSGNVPELIPRGVNMMGCSVRVVEHIRGAACCSWAG